MNRRYMPITLPSAQWQIVLAALADDTAHMTRLACNPAFAEFAEYYRTEAITTRALQVTIARWIAIEHPARYSHIADDYPIRATLRLDELSTIQRALSGFAAALQEAHTTDTHPDPASIRAIYDAIGAQWQLTHHTKLSVLRRSPNHARKIDPS